MRSARRPVELSPTARAALSSGRPLAEIRAAKVRERMARLARIADGTDPELRVVRCVPQAAYRTRQARAAAAAAAEVVRLQNVRLALAARPSLYLEPT